MRILIADDEEYIREGLKGSIPWDELGISEIDLAKDGAEAMEYYAQYNHDIVITDILMPKVDGLTLIKRIREQNGRVPIIILSAYDHFQYAKEAVHLNVSQYILKPIMIAEIVRVVREVAAELETIRKSQQYQQGFLRKLQDMLPLMKEKYLYDLLVMPGSIKDELPQQVEFYQIDPMILQGGFVATLQIFRPDNGKVDSEKDWQIFKYAVNNIVQEILSEHPHCIALQYVDNKIPVLFFGRGGREMERKALEACQRIIECINMYLQLESNIGIGRWYASAKSFSYSFKESCEALNYGEFEGFGRIDTFVGIGELRMNSHSYPLECVDNIAEAIKGRDGDTAWREWDNLQSALLAESSSLAMAKTAYTILFSRLSMLFEPYAESCRELNVNVFRDIHRQQTKLRLISCVKQIFHGLVRELCRENDAEGRCSYSEYIKRYVDEHYHEDISFSQLAKELFLSRNYLSYVFKRDTGDSFVNYLIKYRIEKAKQLMRSTNNLMIKEIAVMVGYQDSAYFSRIFKTVTGQNPSEFFMRIKG